MIGVSLHDYRNVFGVGDALTEFEGLPHFFEGIPKLPGQARRGDDSAGDQIPVPDAFLSGIQGVGDALFGFRQILGDAALAFLSQRQFGNVVGKDQQAADLARGVEPGLDDPAKIKRFPPWRYKGLAFDMDHLALEAACVHVEPSLREVGEDLAVEPANKGLIGVVRELAPAA